MEDFEKLGVFYLGRPYDLDARKSREGVTLYDSRDLLTHAVCIGMTGSGKTGLCLGLLEEAAIDRIPVIAIDPKGDLTNLLLTFPGLQKEEFLPWINLDDARRKAVTPEEFAAEQASTWKSGLEKWGQSGERVKMLKDSAEFAIYTPGSTAGLPISILKSFAAPPPAVMEDSDALRDRINTGATSILALLGIDADPLKSKEHILISNILNSLWQQGNDLSLLALIEQIQNPPFTQIGALNLESFFPAKERFELAMSLNNLLAAPGFESWLKGEALDIDRILYSPEGKPRISVFSISHLGDSERMFFVTLLLNQVVSWMRAQSGTTSLRAIVFMDEIFGYFPPVSSPPSKAPLLTLLKQARAFGVGVLLASQNPVDLDYKGLANTGTWFVGRLQTERDKMRLLDGLEGAATTAGSQFDRQKIDKVLSGLGSRVFLMNNVHNDGPQIFETRWTLSYLRGPLTRDQIKQLMAPHKNKTAQPAGSQPAAAQAEVKPQSGPPAAAPAATTGGAVRPVLPPGVDQQFLPVAGQMPAGAKPFYRPMVLASATVRFADTKTGVDVNQEVTYLVPISGETPPVNWSDGTRVRLGSGALETKAEPNAAFGELPNAAAQAGNYKTWNKDFATWLYNNQKLWLLKSTVCGELSKPQENERDFRIRLSQLAREERDRQAEKLRDKYAPKMTTLQDRIRRAEHEAEIEAQAARDEQMNSAISVGATLLGAFMSKRRVSATTISRASTAARGVGRASRKQAQAANAQENLDALSNQFAQLEADFKQEMSQLERKFDAQSETLEQVAVTPKKTNIAVKMLSLAWVPSWQDAGGQITKIWC